jgi:hypothetical protein
MTLIGRQAVPSVSWLYELLLYWRLEMACASRDTPRGASVMEKASGSATGAGAGAARAPLMRARERRVSFMLESECG